MNSFMSWVGGKKALRDAVLARFPPYYERYIEVFGGAGWVLFRKPPGMDFEVYNDFNGNLANLYRCVRDKPNKLKYKLRYVLNSREDFDLIASLHKRGLFFFYCDPPYFATENYYKDVGFKTKDHIRLRDSLMDIKGKFLVSYNDCPEIRELWDKPNIHIEEISRVNNLAQRYDGGCQYAELLISNYDTSERLQAVRQLSLFDDETDNFGGIIL